MKKSDFYYELPQELIAQDPLADRASSRLMHLPLEGGVVTHHTFRDVKSFLRPGDCLVLNDTKVIPARLMGERGGGGEAEVLLLKRITADTWECIVRPGKKLRTGAEVSFGEGRLMGHIEDVLPDGNRIISFSFEGIWEELLDELGQMPLPPYITHKLQDKQRYQTVYARFEGSAAAPTAGLHFTPELLREINDMGVDLAYVTLHVGLGTFRPVKEEDILDHRMHSEFYTVSPGAANIVNSAKAGGGRVICVGTTSCRTIESAAVDREGFCRRLSDTPELRDVGDDIPGGMYMAPGCADTDIFIYPGYSFRLLDGLITNFHLPESTLIMLVSALAGRERVLAAYEEAVRERYRFFSFGDAMILI